MQPDTLTQVRDLPVPGRDAMLRRDHAVQSFWTQHRQLLIDGWKAWEDAEADRLPTLDDSLIHPVLRTAVDAAWDDPSTQHAVRELWHEVAPGVFHAQLFDVERIADLRAYLKAAADADIPVRPPYGIVLNREGMMLDPRSNGYLAGPSFQAFYDRLMTRYFRPIGRLLFPEIAGYDTQTFGFSIAYRPSTDTNIRPHTDASAATFNININLPDEAFDGSVVDFYRRGQRQPDRFTFEPGVAVIHRGNVAHAAHPITTGHRSNLVLWLYGDHGQMPPRVGDGSPAAPETVWTDPKATPDQFAPF